MLNLSQGTAFSGTTALHRRSAESRFNISNRAPPCASEADIHKHDSLRAMLARIGCGQILLRHGLVVEISQLSRAILEREFRGTTLDGAVRQLVHRAGAHIPVGSTSWLAMSVKEGFTKLVNQITNTRSDEGSAIMLLDLDAHLEPSPATLQRLFGFTAAETELAVELARGHSLLSIACARRLSRTTVRSQLAAVFAKTQTRRQADLVALLGRVAILP